MTTRNLGTCLSLFIYLLIFIYLFISTQKTLSEGASGHKLLLLFIYVPIIIYLCAYLFMCLCQEPALIETFGNVKTTMKLYHVKDK